MVSNYINNFLGLSEVSESDILVFQDGFWINKPLSKLNLSDLPTYSDDVSAGAGGLVVGDVYKTSTGELRIKL